jgi:teichuronic acid biosynthesis glycosyltransferase TuaC
VPEVPARPLKVLFVTNMWPDAERPWYGIFVKTQADSLRELGLTIDTLAVRGYARRGAYVRAARELALARSRPDYDVVHAHYGHAGVLGRLQVRAPLVISYCGDDLLGTPAADGSNTLKSRVEAMLFRQVARVASATITKSAAMEERLPASCRPRNHVIPNGVDLDRFKPIPRLEARRQLGWDPDEPTVLFAGDPRIPRKNHPLAVRACELAAASIPGTRLRVASGLDPAHVPLMMSAADVLLLTSRLEGSPNVVKEAMAAELPVVSTPVGDVEERVDGVDGCYVRPHDAEALGDALVAALRHGRAPGARDAVAGVALEAVARRVIGVYQSVLAR